MSETPNDQSGWEQLAQQIPKLHPALHPHVVRLLAEHDALPPATMPQATDVGVLFQSSTPEDEAPPTIGSFTTRLKEFRQTVENSGKTHFDPHFTHELATELQHGDYTVQELDACIREVDQLEAANLKIEPESYLDLIHLIDHIPADKLKQFYFSDEARQAGGLQDMFLEAICNPLLDSKVAQLMQRITDLPDVLSLKTDEGAHQLDPVVQQIIHNKDFFKVAKNDFYNPLSFSMRPPIQEGSPKEGSPEQLESRDARDWADRYMSTLGLPESITDNIQFGWDIRTSDPVTGYANASKLMRALETTEKNVRELGPDTITKLHDKAAFVNFDYYTATQLTLMDKLLDGDPATLEHLKAGDVTVVYTDGTGDHNSAHRTNSETFATPSGRTLFFEINRPSDFYRHRALLKHHGIKPSTLAIADHGGPGSMYFGKHKSDVEFTVSNRTPDSGNLGEVSISDARGIARIVAEDMQDSRGIDDNPEAIGRRRLILISCSQAAPATIWRPAEDADDTTVSQQPGDKRVESMVSTQESTAATLTKRANYPGLYVYAAAAAIKTTPTANGYTLLTKVEPAEGGPARYVPLAATRLSVDAQGNLIEEWVDEVLLRRHQDTQNTNKENTDE